MEAKLINLMTQLQAAGYHFTRVQARYNLEELLPTELDAQLDHLTDTPAFIERGQLASAQRQFLLVTRHHQVLTTIWLHSPQSEVQLQRWCERQLALSRTQRTA